MRLCGVLCERCVRLRDRTARTISQEALAALRRLQDAEWEEVARLPLPAGLRGELDAALAGFLEYHEEHRRVLRSPVF